MAKLSKIAQAKRLERKPKFKVRLPPLPPLRAEPRLPEQVPDVPHLLPQPRPEGRGDRSHQVELVVSRLACAPLRGTAGGGSQSDRSNRRSADSHPQRAARGPRAARAADQQDEAAHLRGAARRGLRTGGRGAGRRQAGRPDRGPQVRHGQQSRDHRDQPPVEARLAPLRLVPRHPSGDERPRDRGPVHFPGSDGRQRGAQAEPRRRAPRNGLVGGHMSRIGKLPIQIPEKVKVNAQPGLVQVEGPKGKVAQKLDREIKVTVDKGQVRVERPNDSRRSRQLHGLARKLVAHMVFGVTQGSQRSLDIAGVGYKAELKGKEIHLAVGFSHPVRFPLPEGIIAEYDAKANRITVKGADKHLVGLTAAQIRKVRPPEPYKGKGIKYAEETVRRKQGKTGAT